MKKLFIPFQINYKSLDKNKIIKNSDKLPENILIAYSIQNKTNAEKLAKILEKNKKISSVIQVLGCSKPIIQKKVQAIIFFGTGKFHPVSLAYETEKNVYVFQENDFIKIKDSEVEKLKKTQKSSYLNYLNSEKIGIFISVKKGQNRFKKAIDFSKKITLKKHYLFLGDNLNTAEFENFPQITSWINTACPRLDLDNSKIININKINGF